jgi:hypothetical protein
MIGEYFCLESIVDELYGQGDLSVEDEQAGLLEEPDIKSLEDDLFKAQEREQELINIQEMLVEQSGVSRAMAENFRDVLPGDFAMESFTDQVTNTNHVMSLEFIGTAIKLVAAAGVVAVLGGVGYIVFKIMRFKKRLPDMRMDKVVTGMVNTVEDKLRTAITELSHQFPELDHQELKWTREEGIVNAAVRQGMLEIDMDMLSGKYHSLSAIAGTDAMTQAAITEKFFKSTIFPELDKMIKAGTGKDLDNVSGKLADVKIEDRISAHLERFASDKKISFNNHSDIAQKFRDQFSKPVSASELPGRLKGITINSTAMPEEAITTMFKAQGVMTYLAGQIQTYEKKLKGNKDLPGDYAAQVKELLEKCKPILNALADVFSIVETEVESHKRCSKVKAMAVSNGFKAVSEFYQERAKSDPDNSGEYRKCVGYLKKMFDPIAAALK